MWNRHNPSSCLLGFLDVAVETVQFSPQSYKAALLLYISLFKKRTHTNKQTKKPHKPQETWVQAEQFWRGVSPYHWEPFHHYNPGYQSRLPALCSEWWWPSPWCEGSTGKCHADPVTAHTLNFSQKDNRRRRTIAKRGQKATKNPHKKVLHLYFHSTLILAVQRLCSLNILKWKIPKQLLPLSHPLY